MINPVLLHLWGPFTIHAYGFCISLGILIALYLLHKDPKAQKIICKNDLATALQYMILSGYVGGRLFCLVNEYHVYNDYSFFLKFWEPGFSILGTIISIAIVMFVFLWYKKIPILLYSDRIAIYAPLVQSFGRLGCFFAGCCYGQHTSFWWSVTYTHLEHMAPLGISLHPTQLYSSFLLLIIFLILYFYIQHIVKKSGMILCAYLILTSIERFLVDFLRWDRTWWTSSGLFSHLSTNQWIALALCFCATLGIFIIMYFPKKNHGSV